jgi:transglutaminase-like putative cysteine protease
MKLSLKISVVLSMALSSCISNNHLITDPHYLAETENAFFKKKVLSEARDSALFSVFNQKLATEQTEALKYLYAYMPLNDLADYDGSFFLDNVNISLKARKETSWGKIIPEDIFLHYVLPYRINNENLDSFRIAYYNELYNRVQGKSLEEAALEVNHWCHEKVSYQAADIRTSAPMSTILSGRGRCGEESTFTVAALRTIGIPARQVYTPRWAHSDDNHAWVEIWSKGEWHYMGACEPEPVLDRGWFTEPARRAMLIHTKSFGAYSGSENFIKKYPDYSLINNLAKYAVTKTIAVKVLADNDEPAAGAIVEFQLYNYSEFYPLAVVTADEKGISTFDTGLGDLLIWAYKGDQFDFRKISVGEHDTVILKLNSALRTNKSYDLDLGVPIVRAPYPGPDQKLIDNNSARINSENSIRQKYIDSWMKAADAKKLASELKIDSTRTKAVIERSMGNYREIRRFLISTPDTLKQYALSMLEVLPDKDLRDSKSQTLTDHLLFGSRYCNIDLPSENKLFIEYVLDPRVANEILVPWRHYFNNKLPGQLVKNIAHDPELIVNYLNENIKIDDNENYYGTPLSPVGVNELRVSDKQSRAICFVAICRTFGIPSRLEPGSNVPQYFMGNQWHDIYFKDQVKPDPKKGYIKLHSLDTKPVPEYYIHFTLARFDGGRYNTLEYEYNTKIGDFRGELSLTPGHYMLVTGNRLNDKKILSNISFFDLAPDEHKTLEVKLRKDDSKKVILGKIDPKYFVTIGQDKNTSQACANDKETVLIWIDPDKEPTKHIFNDLPNLKNELDSWGGKFIFLTGYGDKSNTFNPLIYKGLPSNSVFATDPGLKLFNDHIKSMLPSQPDFPVVVISDKDGNIVFVSSGYNIGIGEQILKAVN